MTNRKERIAELKGKAVNIKGDGKGGFVRNPTKERVIAKKALSIIEELEEENKLTQWQPIETAPKEAYILVINNKLEHQPCVGLFGKCNINLPESWFSDIESAINPLPFTPTHWIPLPTKPII